MEALGKSIFLTCSLRWIGGWHVFRGCAGRPQPWRALAASRQAKGGPWCQAAAAAASTLRGCSAGPSQHQPLFVREKIVVHNYLLYMMPHTLAPSLSLATQHCYSNGSDDVLHLASDSGSDTPYCSVAPAPTNSYYRSDYHNSLIVSDTEEGNFRKTTQ